MHTEPPPQPVSIVRLHPDQHRQLLDELRAHATDHRRQTEHLRSIRRNTLIAAIFAGFVAVSAGFAVFEYVRFKMGMAELSRELEAWNAELERRMSAPRPRGTVPDLPSFPLDRGRSSGRSR